MDEKELERLYNAVNSKFDIGDYNTFRTRMQTPEDRKKFYDVVGSKGFDLGEYPFYEERLSGVKKKPVSEDGFTGSANGVSSNQDIENEPLPSQVGEYQQGEVDPPDVFELTKQYNDLSKAEKVNYRYEPQTGATVSDVTPDQEKRDQAKGIKQSLMDLGIDNPETFYNEIKDLTPTEFGTKGFSKQELIADRKDNYNHYLRKIGTIKWRRGLESELADRLTYNLNEGGITKEAYDNVLGSIQSSLKSLRENVGDYRQQRDNARNISFQIKQFGGQKKDELLANYAADISKLYGNAYKKGFEKYAASAPESKYLDNNALLAYEYLQDVSPEKAKQYELLLRDPKTLKDDPDALSAYNRLMLNLKETGIGLQKNAINEDLNSLVKVSKENDGLTPEQLQEVEKLQERLHTIETFENTLDSEYPERIEDEVDDAVQEIMGQKTGYASYVPLKAKNAVKNTVKGVWEMVSEPFLSDESNQMRELSIMGESVQDEKDTHKVDKNVSLQTSKMVFDPQLKSKLDAVNDDNSLTYGEKEDKIQSILRSNRDKFGRVEIAGGKMNVSPASIAYGVTDLATTLLPFFAVEAATGGIGGAGTAAKFFRTANAALLTGFHDHYAESLNKGLRGSNAYFHAMGMTSIDAAIMAGAGTVEAVKAFYKGKNLSSSKVIEKLSDKEIQAGIDRGLSKGLKSVKQSIVDRAKATPGMIAKGAKTGAEFEVAMAAGEQLKGALNNERIDPKEQTKRAVLGIINFAGMASVLGHAGYKSPNDLQRSYMVDIGKQPDGYKAALEKMRKDGDINKEAYEEKLSIIDRATEAYKTLPKYNSKGKPITEAQKGDYIMQTVAKNEHDANKKNLPPKQAADAELKSKTADYVRQMILDEPTDKQLETQLSKVEKLLEPKKDADGKIEEMPENERLELKAEKDAIEFIINERKEKGEPLIPKGEPEQISQPIELSTEVGELKPGEPAKQEAKPTVSSEGELTQRQLDNREKKRIEDIVDVVEGGDIKGSSISVGDKDLVEHLIDTGMSGREAYVVKEEIESLIKPLQRITDKIDPEELKFLTENVEDINSVMEGLEDAKMMAFSRNKDIVDGVNKEAKRLLDFYSDKNNLADNKLDTESTFAAKVDLLDKFLKGELNYLDLSKFGVEKKAKDYFKPKIKQEKKPAQSKEPSTPVSEGKTKVQNEAATEKPIEPVESIKAEEVITPKETVIEVSEGGGEPPKGEEPKVAEGEDRNIGITHKRMDELANEYGMPTYEKDPQTVKEWDEQATARIKKDPDSINKLMNKMREGDVPDPVEQRMVLQYIASLDAKLRSNPTPELLKELNRAKDISNIAGGRLWGQIGAARKGFKTSEDTLGGYLTTWTEAHGSETLPKETIKDLTARFDKEQELKTKIDEAYAKGREEAINEMAAEGYSKERSSAKKGKTDYKSKRQELKDRLKKEFDEYLSEGKKLGIAKDGTESFRLSLKMAKTIGEYVKTFAEEGVSKLDDVINKVYEEIKDVFPATKKDIRDVIAGVYKEPKATRNELAETVRNLQTEANLLNKIEQERLGYEKAPTAEKIKRTARIEELQKRLEEVKKLKKAEVADEPVGEKSFGEMPKDELTKFKEKRLREIAKLKERIKSGDYAEKPKVMKPIKLDKEAQRLEEEYEKMKEQDTYEQEKAKYDRLSKTTKAWDKVLKFLGVKRIIQTAFDVSIPFRQNVVTTMNPRKWLPRIEDGKLKTPTNIRQFKNMFTFLASPKAMKEYIRNLKQTGEFYEMEKDGIQFSDPSEMRLTKREEDFRNNIFEGLREYRGEKNIALKGLSYIGEPIFASERAAAGALNTVRVERYRAGKRMLEQQGITRQNNPEAYVKLAEWVMNLTGRGKMLEMIEESGKAKKLMGNTFYGARLMASRINLIKNPFFSKMPKELRVQAFKDMAGFSSGVVLTGLALMAAGGKVSFDPDSPDFMQVRFGDKVYDITGGMSAYMKIFFRMTKAAFMQSKAIVDKSERKDANDYARFFGSSGGSFITNKLAPNTATIYHLFKGKSPGKEEFDPTELIEFYPMYVDDMKDAWGDEGASALLTLLLPNLFGIGTNEYPDKGGYEASKSKKQGMPQKKQKPTKEKKFAP